MSLRVYIKDQITPALFCNPPPIFKALNSFLPPSFLCKPRSGYKIPSCLVQGFAANIDQCDALMIRPMRKEEYIQNLPKVGNKH